jgi:hypothetical protein
LIDIDIQVALHTIIIPGEEAIFDDKLGCDIIKRIPCYIDSPGISLKLIPGKCAVIEIQMKSLIHGTERALIYSFNRNEIRFFLLSLQPKSAL